MNISMNIGLAPIIGVPLPFVSYGGSSILMSFVAIGILQSIVIHKAEYL
jgi:rod shape determining protein RodA